MRYFRFSLPVWATLFFVLYTALSLATLTRFPFVHSDESWLSGLSRNILATGDFSVTEPFFDLQERHPHAIKILFHSLQIIFIKLLGYHIFGMRLISLLCGLLSLYLFYRLGRLLFKSKQLAIIGTVCLALDVQFLYASHLARQEIILTLLLLAGLLVFFRFLDNHRPSHDYLLGVVIGLGIGVHPNSFVISLPFGLAYLYHILFTRKLSLKDLLRYILSLAGFAALFILLSLSFDPDFFSNYARYGNEFEVFNPLTSKLAEVIYFYQKLLYRVSGTYYLPDLRFQFLLFPLLLLFGLRRSLATADREERDTLAVILLAIAGVNAGIIMIGRYNQTSIVFQFPLFYLLLTAFFGRLTNSARRGAFLLTTLLLGCLTLINVFPFLSPDYNRYLQEIGRFVPPTARVLANLNADYYFENGRLRDYRNLAYLQKAGLDFADYIRQNDIEYILYPEEMEVIYRERPKWNGLYGALAYYGEMQAFFAEHCQLAGQFTDPIYGMRIVRYLQAKDWTIKVYRVIPPANPGE